MDDINRPKRPDNYARYYSHRNKAPIISAQKTADTAATESKDFDLDTYIRNIKKQRGGLVSRTRGYLKADFKTWGRNLSTLITVGVVIFSVALPFMQEALNHVTYAIGRSEEGVLLKTNDYMSKKLVYDGKEGVYNFNQDYKPRNPGSDLGAGGSLIKAKLYEDPTKGLEITDPINQVDFKLKPLFWTGTGKQQSNRVVYPMAGGHMVYTAGAIGVKEDITLEHYVKDKVTYSYQLELGDQFGARLTSEGAVGIYGSSLPINGNVSTGNDKDAALLAKARKAATKDKLLFTLPAPTIKESGIQPPKARAKFELQGDKLLIHAENLRQASYPLSIDPTITTTAGSTGNGLFSFDANIETNVYVDLASNNFIERSPLTGGNIGAWNTSTSSANGNTQAVHFLGAAVVYAGTLYVIGGTNGTTTTNITNAANSHLVEQSKINSDGTLAGFTDGNYTNLPANGISRFKVLSYNGYMYIIDGSTTNTTGAALSDAVYYTRITSESFGAFTNGAQLKNWGTTTNKPSTALYDYGATAHEGYIYVSGGLNQGSTTPQSAVLYATILPSGDLGTFTTQTAMSGTRFGHDMQAYNGHLYILGGNTNTIASPTITASTIYASIASNGTIADTSWKPGSNLVNSTGASNQTIQNFGAQFSMIYNGYLYVAGGCTSTNTTDSCAASSVASYAQLAQLNADGSLGTFFPNDFPNSGTTTLQRAGTPSVGYNSSFYSVGGCSAFNAGSSSCATTVSTTSFATVNTVVGDVSDNRNPGDLPVALYGHGTAVLNGYLYAIGGCLTVGCNGTRVTSYDTYWALIAADGTIGSWTGTNTTDTGHYQMALHRDNANGAGGGDTGNSNCSTNSLIQGADNCGVAGMAVATYNGYIYVFGGADGANINHTVYYTKPLASTGALTGNPAWTASTNQFGTTNVSEAGAFARNGALYVIGGCVGGGAGIACTNTQNTVYKSSIGAIGAPGAFAITNQLQLPTGANTGRAAFGLALSGDYIYLAGGIRTGNTYTDNQLSSITRAKLDASGNIVNVSTGLSTGTWTDTTGTMSAARRRNVSAVVNGYLYIIAGHNACTDPPGCAASATYGDIQIGKIDMSVGGTGNIASFTQSNTGAVTPRWNPAIVFDAGFIYVTGGCTVGAPPASCTTIGTVTESFVVYNANNLGVNTWTNPTAYSTNRLGAGTAVYNGYLYTAGGCTTYTMATLACSAVSTDVSFVAINADGTLGSWSSNASYALPAGRAFGQLVAQNGYLYFLGGQDNTGISGAQSTVYKSTIGASGTPGAFSSTGQTALTSALTQASAVAYASFIFIAGGYTGSAYSPSIYNSTIDASGNITAWTKRTDFTTGRKELSLISAGAYLYVIGGFDGTTYYSDVQVATPSTSNGNVTSWSKNQEIPYQLGGLSAVGANGHIFVFGGRSGTASTSCSSAVYTAAVNGNGTLSEWVQAPNSLGVARFGMGVGYSDGYFFLNGGHDCTNISSASVIQKSGQLSEAIHATYTRYIDFGTDATFRQFYVLGTNAQIGGVDIDLWKIIVKTSTSVNNAWGLTYTTSLSGLGTGPNYGTPITFQALDASGVNQGASQYLDITFDIDQSQSFNFPDTTQPQITKYDLYFSPGPGKRLRDGKTFINEQQTNLDAHP